MNERLYITIPGSFALWLLIFLATSLVINQEAKRQINGQQNITVHVVSAEAKPAAPITPPTPEPTKPETKKPPINPIKPLKRIEPPKSVPEKQKDTLETKSAPKQDLSEAKTDNKGPTILYQPLPKIPDDLRHEDYSTQAMARFHVAADGSQTVELLTPSQNPRLNHILLETLKTWRFQPATNNNDQPVASTFDIRVKFTVE